MCSAILRQIAFTLIIANLAVAADFREFKVEDDSGQVFRAYCAVFSPDGKIIVSGGDISRSAGGKRSGRKTPMSAAIQVWNAETGELVGQSIAKEIRSLSSIGFLNGDETVVASGFGAHPKELRFWSVAKRSDRKLDWITPKERGAVSMLRRPVTTPDQVVVHSAASPDGTQLAAIGVFGFANDLTSLNVWKKDGSKVTYCRRVANRWLAHDVAWSPKMNYLATISQSRVEPMHNVLAIEVWRADNPDEPTLTIETQVARDSGRFVFFGVDGQSIFYLKQGALVEHKLDAEEAVEYAGGFDQFHAAAISPTGDIVATISSNDRTTELVSWSTKTRQIISKRAATPGHWRGQLTFSSDEKYLAISNGTLKLWTVDALKKPEVRSATPKP